MSENPQIPEISQEMKQQLKNDRLMSLKARIFNMQMDIVSYEATGDSARLQVAQQELKKLVLSYHAVEAMD